MASFITIASSIRDFFYLLAIAAMAGYILQTRSSDAVQTPKNDVLALATHVLQEGNQDCLLEQIREYSNNFPTVQWLAVYKARSEEAVQACQSLNAETISAEGIKSLLAKLGTLVDGDKAVVQSLHICLQDAEQAKVQERQFRIALACSTVLDFYRRRAKPNCELTFDRFFPMFMPSKYGVRSGEPFKADVFLSTIASLPDSMEMLVNGRPILQKDGIGLYSCTFDAPGEKHLEVEIRCYDTTSQQVTLFKKEVNVQVLK